MCIRDSPIPDHDVEWAQGYCFFEGYLGTNDSARRVELLRAMRSHEIRDSEMKRDRRRAKLNSAILAHPAVSARAMSFFDERRSCPVFTKPWFRQGGGPGPDKIQIHFVANGNSKELNLEVFGSVGVCPPCLNNAIPMMTVRPEAKIFIASPDITWLPR